jgi:mono/diheme cytochrome c family protein
MKSFLLALSLSVLCTIACSGGGKKAGGGAGGGGDVAGGAGGGDAAAGKELFNTNCESCHRGGSQDIKSGTSVAALDNAFKNKGNGQMLGFVNLSKEKKENLVAYIKTNPW